MQEMSKRSNEREHSNMPCTRKTVHASPFN